MLDGLEQEEIDLLFDECRSKLNEVENDLLNLAEGRTGGSPEVIARIFRAFHSVKGAAGYLRYEPLKHLSHAAEDFLVEVRDGRRKLSPAHANILLSAADRMAMMIASGDPLPHVNYETELEQLKALTNPPRGVGSTRPAHSALAEPPHWRRLKVLVVEDDFTARVALQGFLSRYGDCHIAVNGREAVAAFLSAMEAGEAYDLICMDIRMPELDGTEAVQQIRAIEQARDILSSAGVKIFMATGIMEIKAVTRSFNALCDAYLFKPIDGAKLEDHLKAFGLIGRTRGETSEVEALAAIQANIQDNRTRGDSDGQVLESARRG